MSDTVIVYVTRNGHSRDLALDLGPRLGAKVHEIGDLAARKGILGWINAGRLASMKAATPIGDPGIDLGPIKTVVFVQPVWASSVCPPLRSWLRAHAKDLAGKRLGMVASSYATQSDLVRTAFEGEYAAELGALVACASVFQRATVAQKEMILDGFVAELARK